MQVVRTALLLLVAVSLVACATRTRESVDFNTKFDFSSVKTLAFYEDKEGGADDAPDSPRDLTRKAIDRELRASGYSIASPRQADLFIIYHVGARAKVRTSGMISGEGGADGVMVISFRDPKTERSIWYGRGEVTIGQRTDARREIDRISKSLLSRFPPPPGSRSDEPM